MRIGDINLELRIWLAKSAEASSAALCGSFVAAGLLSLASNDFRLDGGGVIGVLLLTVFTLTVVCGIYRRPRLMAKAMFALFLAGTALLCPPPQAWKILVVLCPILFPLLIFGARWKGARFAALPLVLIAAFKISEPRAPLSPGENPPISLYLPATLAHETPGDLLLFFGEADPEGEALLKAIPLRDGWLRIDSPQVTHGLRIMQNDAPRFKIAIAGRSERLSGVQLRKGVYRWLIGRLEPDGVLIMPVAETELLPPGDWKYSVLPGGDGKWAAARRGDAVRVDPETLEARINEFSSPEVPPVLPTGAFEAIYPPPPKVEIKIPPCKTSEAVYWLRLAVAAAVWAVLRLLFCRRAHMGTAAAAAETTAAMVLYSLAILPKWSANMMDTGLSPFALFAGVGMLLLPRPFAVVRNGMRILTEAAVGVLPWMPGCSWCWLPLVSWFSWFLSGSAVFTGLRAENRRSTLYGALFGVAVGFPLYGVLGAESSMLPICAAVLLMIPPWLRR